AIYGSRANNGVILITTKKGKNGEATIRINSQFGVQQHGTLTQMTNKNQYVEMYNEAANNDNLGVTNPVLLRELISSDYAATLPDVDHLESVFSKAIIQNHNISISGGSEKIKYFVSGNHFEQEGIVTGSDYQRSGGKIGISFDAKEWLKIDADLNMSLSERNIIGSSGDGYGGNGGSIVRYALFRTPAIPIYDENGEYVDLPEKTVFFGDGYNPVGLANNTYNVKKQNRILSNVKANINLTKELTLVSTFGVDKMNGNQRNFNKTWGSDNRINNPNSLVVGDNSELIWTWNNVLSYNKTLNNVHNISLMIGQEVVNWDGYSNVTTQKDFPDQDINLVYLGNGEGVMSTSESQNGYSLASFFGRANYNYANKYLASLTVRRDGTSRFIEENRWGNFYSVSAGWRIDQESFFEDIDVISQLKLRTGYGAIGNQEVGYYAYSDQISSGFYYPFGNSSSMSYTKTVLGNENLKWETSTQIDIGLDLSLLKGQFNFTTDFFRKVTKDQLVTASLPPSAGEVAETGAPWINNGSVLNQGFEFELNYRQDWKDWGLSFTANLATLHNEVLELNSPILTKGRIDNGVYASRTEEGHAIGSFYLYEMEGIFQNNLDIIGHANQGNDIQPGDVMFKDQDNNSVIDENDRTHVGSPIPTMTYGFSAAAHYKDFDFSMFFQGASGFQVYYQIATDIEGFYRPFNLTKRYYDEHWTGEGSSNTQPRASWNAKQNNCKASTRFLEDGAYIRLKSVQLGYTLPDRVTDIIHIDKLRVYALGQNLYTFTKYPGLDPEMTASNNASGEGDCANNIDWGTYPSAISVNFGLQLTF
nr:SusC/RagA family TonB-linked outer membrane protein [Bacteroidales bacterium]